MKRVGIVGWVALGVSTLLGVLSAAFIVGTLLGRDEVLGAAIVACVALWLVTTVVGGVRAAEPSR